MTTPLVMPGGVYWRARLYKTFLLQAYPQIGFSANSLVRDGGLDVTPEIAMSGVGMNSGRFALTVAPHLGMLPQGFNMAVTPSIGMAGSPCYGVQLAVNPQLSMQAIGNMAFNLGVTPNISMVGFAPPPTFDAVAGGTGTSGGSWTHTAAAGAYVLVDVVCDRTVAVSVTYGGLPMVELGSAVLTGGASGNATLTRFGIANVSGGAATVNVSASLATISGSSVSYVNVKSFGATVSSSGTGQSGSQTDSPTSGQLAVQAFGAYDGNISNWSSTSGGTSRYNQSSTGSTYLAVRESTSAVAFSATSSDGTGATHWGGLSTMLSSLAFRPVSYDATGAGAAQNSLTPNVSWSHTIGADANAVLVGVNFTYASSTPPADIVAKIGSTVMTPIGVLHFSNNYVYVFGLLNPPTGTQTFNVSFTSLGGITATPLAANSVSYSGVTGFGNLVTNAGFSSTFSLSAGAPLAPTVFQMFCTDGGPAIGGYSGGTVRWNEYTSGTDCPILIADASAGTSNLSFSASEGGSSFVNWVGLAIPLY